MADVRECDTLKGLLSAYGANTMLAIEPAWGNGMVRKVYVVLGW